MIKKGDLVVVVREHCSGSAALGLVREVRRVFNSVATCSVCGHIAAEPLADLGVDPADGMLWTIPLPWLKRIPPLSELESEKERKELHA